MYNAVWIASIFGPVLALIGLWVLVKTQEAEAVWDYTKKTPAMLYFWTVLNLIFGSFILNCFHSWVRHPVVLVTILGWFMILRGLCGLFCSKMIVQRTMTTTHYRIMGIIALVYGLLLSWISYTY